MLPGTLAMQMGIITNGYLAYDLTGSAAAVGFVTLGFGIPMLLLSLVGGVVADRFSKRSVLLTTQTTVGLAAVIMAALVLTGVIQIWHMTLVALMMGTAFAFNMPARQAFVAELVGRARVSNAVALNSTGMNASRVIGPALAGALIGISFIGIGGVYVIMALMYVYVIVSLARIPDRGVAANARRSSGLRSLVDGLHYIRGNPVIFALLLLGFAPIVLGMPYQALMPVFAEDVFHVGPGGLGLLMTFNGIGALAGSLAIASLGGFRRRGLLQIALGLAFGLGLAVFSFGQSYHLALAILPLVGGVSSAYLAQNMSLVMDKSEPAYHGRVMSIHMMTFSLMPLAITPFGAVVDLFGAPLTVGIAGLLLALVVGVYGTLHPSYRHLQ